MIPGQPPQPAGQPPGGQPMAQPFPASPPPQGNAQPPVTIEAVVKLLRDERMRGFRIDIETDSLVESDQKQERADANELVGAIGGFFKEFGPIVQAMPPLAPLASGLLQFALRRYKVGAELEELVEKTMGDVAQHLANPPPPQPDPTEQVKIQQAQIKAQAEGQKAQAGIQAVQVKAQTDQQTAQIDMAGKVLEHQHKTAEHQMNMQQMHAENEMEARALEMRGAAAEHGHELKLEQMDHAAKQAKKPKAGE